MSTKTQVEGRALREHANALLHVTWVRKLEGLDPDGTLTDIPLAAPVPVRVLPMPRGRMMTWNENWLDPQWDVEPLFPNPVFDAYRARGPLRVQAPSHNLQGRREPNAVLEGHTPDTSARSAARAAFALRVYVPREGTQAAREVHAGSAIVGREACDGYVHVDFEGSPYQTFEERLRCAANRHLTGYPTVARTGIPVADLIEVGRYDPQDSTMTPARNAAAQRALGRWLNQPAPASGPGL
jgi:hypothetical protein